jgi:hypothetical protein
MKWRCAPRSFPWGLPRACGCSGVQAPGDCGPSRLSDAQDCEKDRNRPGRKWAVRTGGNRVIRQAISCDICASEKKQTNHWFVAYEQGGELRVSGWQTRNRLRPGSKHLCGQTCLHKLVDDFMARALTARTPRAAENVVEERVMERAAIADTSLTSDAAYQEFESSARLIPTPEPVKAARLAAEQRQNSSAAAAPARTPLRMPLELVAVAPAKVCGEENAVAVNEPPRYASRNWRAAAWEREREREMRSGERHPGVAARRRNAS